MLLCACWAVVLSLARICWKLSGLGCLHLLTVVRLFSKWLLSWDDLSLLYYALPHQLTLDWFCLFPHNKGVWHPFIILNVHPVIHFLSLCWGLTYAYHLSSEVLPLLYSCGYLFPTKAGWRLQPNTERDIPPPWEHWCLHRENPLLRFLMLQTLKVSISLLVPWRPWHTKARCFLHAEVGRMSTVPHSILYFISWALTQDCLCLCVNTSF